jgi:tRNA(Arg) A34 adenosine deaminase TadA
MTEQCSKEGSYPAWVLEILQPGTIHEERKLMQLAIRVALANVRETGGGPFGAIIATGTGEVVSVGYNRVVPSHDSTAHAEIVAIRRAEAVLGTFQLRGGTLPLLKLFTTCAPCIMCTGAIHWAGVSAVIAAARAEDAEAIGFIEGPRNWDVAEFLRARGIEYRADFLREEALEIFRQYAGPVYNG